MKKTWRSFLLLGLVLLLATSITGCSTPVSDETEPADETSIPAHFTTYTDEASYFSISYPPDWELLLSEIEFLEQVTKALMESIKSGLPLERAGTIFFAGVPTELGYSPNVNIVIESLPGADWTLDEYVEAAIRGVKSVAQEYHEFSRIKTTVDGREAVIIDFEADIPGLGRFHYLQMSMLVDNIAWIITCTSELGKFDESEDDLHAIVRSLRILE